MTREATRMARGNNHGRSKRGRHKKAASAETQRWEREHLIPERPAWCDVVTYGKLAQLRSEIALPGVQTDNAL